MEFAPSHRDICCMCVSDGKHLFCSLDELKEGSKALHDVLEIDLPKLMKEKPHTASPSDSSNICDRCGRNLYASEE